MSEYDLAAVAVPRNEDVPRDGRSLARHLDVVWANYQDGFLSADHFLSSVADQCLGTMQVSLHDL
jgi:hypothetical protein